MLRKHVLIALGVFFSLATSAVVVAQSPPPVEVFTKPEQIQPYSLELSPSGQHYALIAPRADRSSLLIIDRATNQVTANITPGKGQFIHQYWWVSNNRVVLSMAEKEGGFDQPSSYGELWGINADGKDNKYLFGYRGSDDVGSNIKRNTATQGSAFVLEPKADDKGTILIGIAYWDVSDEVGRLTLARLNVKTGVLIKTGGRIPLREVNDVLVDSTSKVRVVSGILPDRYSKLLYRNPETNEWLTLNDQEISGKVVAPFAMIGDTQKFYVSVDEPGKKTYLAIMDPQSRAVEKVFEPVDADIGMLMMKAGGKDAYAVQTFEGSGRGGFTFLDKAAPEAELTRNLNKQFQGELAYVTSMSDDGNYASVFVTSDVNPGEYYIYSRDKNSLSPPLKLRPDIDINASAVMEPISFKARDGLLIRGWLTVPNNPVGKMPLIVMPHGGPYDVVDRWKYENEAQLFASRGYAVLQVNFRGSGGYGMDFTNAGVREWGGKMQHDVTDGTREVLAKYAIDPNKVCIYGISYGAYASLMGVATEPGLYKCAIGYSGVYDLNMMKSQGDITRRASGRTYLNDVLDSDKTWLAQRSPTMQAARIKAPVLLIHGGQDERTPPAQAEAMRRALIGAGNPPEWVYESSEGHGFYDPKNRLNAYMKILEFLDKHIGQKKQ